MSSVLYFPAIPLLALILLAQGVYMPASVSGVWGLMLFILIWRYVKKKFSPVSMWLLIGLVITCLLCIYLQFKSFWGVEAGVALLTSCLFAKCLESKTIRDLLIVFNFGLFVSASLFLHSQSLGMACMVLGCLIFCFIGLYRIQTTGFSKSLTQKISLKNDARHVFKFLAIALPFFMLLFLFFPRLPPLWRVPIASGQGVTGMSDRMSPGDIAQLSQSSALVFRVIGPLEQLPQRQNMYWRAMVLDDYDGKVWTSSPINQAPAHYSAENPKAIAYRYLSADEQQPWIMSLEYSVPANGFYQQSTDGSIKARRMVQRNKPVSLSWVGSQDHIDANSEILLAHARKISLQDNPKTQALAKILLEKSHHQPKDYVEQVLRWYRQQKFIYTLSPGVLEGNRNDQFLFQTRKGFCEHYASSFVILMRYAGIPARVVIGYQGGQLAPDAKSWEVRQLDAHAWAEVYLEEKWVRIDPTAMVAPTRLNEGMQQYLGQDHNVWGEQSNVFRQQQFNVLRKIRVWGDYLGYQWQSKVVGYDVDQQRNWLSRLGFTSVYSYILIIITGIFLLILLFVIWNWHQKQKNLSFVEREIFRFEQKLSVNMQKQISETFRQWMHRLALYSQQEENFTEAVKVYEKIIFYEQNTVQDRLKFRMLLKVCADELRRD